MGSEAIMKVGPAICGERRDVYEPMGNTDSEEEDSDTLPTGGLRKVTERATLSATIIHYK